MRTAIILEPSERDRTAETQSLYRKPAIVSVLYLFAVKKAA